MQSQRSSEQSPLSSMMSHHLSEPSHRPSEHPNHQSEPSPPASMSVHHISFLTLNLTGQSPRSPLLWRGVGGEALNYKK
jgi:hypothetical protein